MDAIGEWKTESETHSLIIDELVHEVICEFDFSSICSEVLVAAELEAKERDCVQRQEQDRNEFIQSMDVPPVWVARFAMGENQGKMTHVQRTLMEDLNKNLIVDPAAQRYSIATKYLNKFLSLSMSETDYETRKFMPAPSLKVLKNMDYPILTDIGVTARNFYEATQFFSETVSSHEDNFKALLHDLSCSHENKKIIKPVNEVLISVNYSTSTKDLTHFKSMKLPPL